MQYIRIPCIQVCLHVCAWVRVCVSNTHGKSRIFLSFISLSTWMRTKVKKTTTTVKNMRIHVRRNMYYSFYAIRMLNAASESTLAKEILRRRCMDLNEKCSNPFLFLAICQIVLCFWSLPLPRTRQLVHPVSQAHPYIFVRRKKGKKYKWFALNKTKESEKKHTTKHRNNVQIKSVNLLWLLSC